MPKSNKPTAPAELISVKALTPIDAGDGRVDIGTELQLTKKDAEELVAIGAVELIAVEAAA